MGLDMYLTKEIYIGAEYEHNEIAGVISLTRRGNPIKVNVSKVSKIIEEVGYWRKANHIHNWFVRNVQSGVDDCRRVSVSWAKLQELKSICQEILTTGNTEKLPPARGFFFGPAEIDSWYWEELDSTIGIINDLDPDGDYYYRSSW